MYSQPVTVFRSCHDRIFFSSLFLNITEWNNCFRYFCANVRVSHEVLNIHSEIKFVVPSHISDKLNFRFFTGWLSRSDKTEARKTNKLN